jgi:phage terminase large subunit-like protein
MAMFGLRLGDKPQSLITTTPKPLKIFKTLISDPKTVVTRGSTFDNAANLAGTFLKAIKDKYEGTRLGRQELYAEVMEEAEGALWTRQMVEDARHTGALPEMARIVVSIDPATTNKEDSAETGIIAAGLGRDGLGYVLDDGSGRYSPGDWAKKSVGMFRQLGADRFVAEGNQGGEMVRHTIKTEWATAPITIVYASRGKAARAEPVAALYEQGKVKHAGPNLSTLEDQLCTWEPLSGMPSPDRLDALVWALTELLVKDKAPVAASGATRRN